MPRASRSAESPAPHAMPRSALSPAPHAMPAKPSSLAPAEQPTKVGGASSSWIVGVAGS